MLNLQSRKKPTFKEALLHSLPVLDEHDNAIAILVPIGEWALGDEILLQNFANWRRTFMRFFLTQFEATAASTKDYLQNLSITQSDRIFFAIYVENDLIGHIGLSNINNSEAELDNIIRGKSGGHKDLMYFAEKTVLDWAFFSLKVKRVVAQVMSKNIMAMALHQRFGFKLIEQHYLTKIVNKASIVYEKSTESDATESFFLDIIAIDLKTYTVSAGRADD